jgi:hypothetical protein
MINLDFTIDNPFSKRFGLLSSKSKMLTKHKAVEANIYCTANIIKLSLVYSTAQDHAGLQLEVGLFGYNFELHFYDTRHWNDKNKDWETRC